MALDTVSGASDIGSRLAEATRAGRYYEASQIRWFDFVRLGRSAKVAASVFTGPKRLGVLSIVRSHATELDIVIPGEEGALVIFNHADSARIAAIAKAIERRIALFLLGEEGGADAGDVADPYGVAAAAKAAPKLASVGAKPAWAAPAVPDGPLRSGFMPIYAVKSKAVTCHFSAPLRVLADGGQRYGYETAYGETGRSESHDFFALDERLLKAALQGAADLSAAKARALIGVTVHSSTLRAGKSLLGYLGRIKSAPHHIQQRLVVVVSEIPAGTQLMTVSDWIGFLKPYCLRVALEFPIAERGVERFAGCGAWAIGAHAQQHGRANDDDVRNSVGAAMAYWAKTAPMLGAKSFIYGLRDPALIGFAERIGLDFIAALDEWPFRSTPTDIYAATAPKAA